MTPGAFSYLIASLATGGGLLVIFLAVRSSQTKLQQRLAKRDPSVLQEIPESPFATVGDLRQRVLGPAVARLTSLASRKAPSGALTDLERKLSLVAQDWVGMTAASFLVLNIVTSVAGLLIGLVFVELLAISDPLTGLIIVFAGLIAGYLGPRLALDRRIKARNRQMVVELPDILDTLVISMEGGMGIDAGLNQVATLSPTYLGAEIRRLTGEVALGRPRNEAFAAMGERNNIEELTAVLAPIAQATSLGVELAPALRAQAEEVRRNRRQKAEESAAKLPLKMLFPMVGCIFPAMFVVLLGPAIILVISGGGAG